ncbi:MAG: transcription antitermination factor NusB [Lachnospiraceae bacterium]|nr:transcription antitermination factor NusB [Lachnospiraceae bacterium]MBR3232117.1 transcription antitermination factor NusB [Lachnospiraceae bacterium]MBR6398130.1 transcription antitermination factor NusB [Lachnospiraceae bacterium]MBR7014922.1 transcription antitermination factor NusB [Lachnospiraceae bacterium]MEE1109462.1 transcription antitermination factor NusB [Lachnospiraceae bacterium]
MSRRKLRVHLFKMIFIFAFTLERDMPEQLSLYLDSIEGLSEEDRAYLLERYEKVHDKIPEIDRMLNDTARGWKTDRFASCDLAILRVACYELIFDEAIPEGVAINEAVELAKQFGGDESPSFINGILGEIAKKA